MKNLITYLKTLWSRVSGSQRKKIGVTLGEATIEHPFSTYSAPFGTCWQPSGKLHSVVRCAAMLVMLLTIGSGNAWGESFTFTPTSASAGTLSGAPTGVTATFSNSYNSANQITKNNSQTLTLSGLDGCTITGVSVSVHNNKSSGAGSGSLTINGSNKGSLSGISGLGNSSWTTKNFTVTSTEVATGGTVVVTISCSTSSVYCNLYTITYTPASGPTCSTNPTVGGSSNSSINVTGGTVSCTGITKGDCDIDEWGFVYGTATEPTGNAQKVSSGKSTSNVSSFNKALTGLDPNQKYYVRAYAKVGSSTFYGSETNFTTKTITASSSNTTYGTVSRNKMVITGSPKSGGQYASPAYTISGSTPANATTVSQVGNTFTVTSTSTTNITVTINFEAVPTYTVTWVAGSNSSFNSQTGTAGTALTNPGTPSAASYCPGGKVFVGWTETPIVGETNTVPADLFSSAEATSKTIPSGGTTYYAVFATEAASNSYTQITAEADLEAGKNYLIVGYASSTYKALPVDAASSLTTVSVSSSSISSPAAALIWTLEGSADAWKIKSTNNNKYLQISGGSLTFETSTSLTFSVGVSSSVFTFTSSASSGNKILSYYANGNCFNAYTKANTVYVYKQGVTRSAYATTCCTPWDDPTFSYNTYSLTAGGAHATKTITGTTHGTLSFESSNTGVITVNETTGEVTPVGAGTAHVIASWTAADGYCAKEMNSSDFTVTGNVTVTFKRNGGGGAADNQTQSVPYNEATALKTVATIGYTAPNSCKQFGGWATSEANATAGTVAYADGADITATGATTLWAIWTDITYAVSDGTMVGVGSHSYSANPITCGTTLTITCAADGDHKGNPTVTATGTHGTITVVSATSVTIANVTSAIAVSISYAEKTNVTATWNANNGSVTGGGTTTQKEGSTFTFPNVTSTDCGTFLGWTDAAHSSYSSTSGKPSPCYNAGSTIVLNANTQFYAVYSKVGDDAVAATLYAHAGGTNTITNAGYTNVTVTTNGLGTYSDASYAVKFDGTSCYAIFALDGTPTSFSCALKTLDNGSSGTSTMTLYEAETAEGPWTPIKSVNCTTHSTTYTLSETTASNFSQRVLKIQLSAYSRNIKCGDITINGLRAPIYYTTNPGCVDWVLDAISVTTAPTKTTYNECETFDPTGMAVTATMKENGNPSNTTTKDVAGYTWTPTQFLTPGNSIPVTISYTEKGVTRTTTQTVRVNDLPNYTITFHDGDGTTTWTQSNHCDACNLDSRTGSLACGDYTFAGWSTSSTTYDDENATITTWVSGSYTPTANTDLYAVYRKGATPPAFTANCEGGTFYIYEANGNTHMAGRVNATPRAYTSEYWNNDGGTGCVSCLEDGDDGTPFTFTRIADNTYKIQNHDGEYLRKYSSGNHPDFESTWYNEDNFKWIISAGTNGTWRFTNKAATEYALVKSGNYFDFQLASNVTSSSSYYDLELEPAASTVYQSNPNCASTYTITFNTHGGTFVQGNYAYATETTSGLSGTTTSKFPSATLSGCTFAGWKEGSVQEEVASSSEGDAPILIAADANMSVSSNKTYHAVYHYYDEDWSFDPTEGGTYHMYATISGTKHFCSGTPGTSYGILTSTTDCNDVVDVVITPGTGANVGKYKINIGGYDVSPELNGTGLKRGTFWWNIVEVDDNLYHITADGAESGRSLNYYSTSSAFTHYKDNGAGNTKDISFGRCRQHHWTSEPVLVPMVVLNSNSNIMVTSTNGQTLRSTTMLTVTATHYGETTKIYLSANVAGVGFLKSDGTALSSDAGGSYLQTDAEGELATSVYVTYAPTVTTDGIENVTITARDGHSPSPLSQTTRSAQVRHLPTKFIIAQKVGDDWYALPNDMGNNYTSSTAAVKLSSVNESTGVATFYSEVTDQFAYQLRASKGLDNKGMVFSSPVKSNNVIKANTTSSISTIGLYAQSGWTGANVQYYEFTPTTNDLVDYTLKNTFQNNFLGITTGTWGIGSTNNVRFFSIDQQPAATITWQNDMLEAVHATNKAENGVVTLPTGADPEACAAAGALLTFDGWVTETWNGYKTSDFKRVNAGDAATTITYYAVFKTSDNKYFTKCPSIQTVTYKANGGTGSDVVESYAMVSSSGTAVTLKDIGTGDGQIHFTKEGYVFVGWTTSSNYGSEFKYAGNSVTVKPEDSGNYGDLTLSAVWVGELTITGDVHLTSTYTSAARSEANTVYTTANPNNLITFSIADVPASVDFKLRTSYLTSGDASQDKNTCPFRLCNDGSSNYNIVDGSNLNVATGDYSQTYAIGYKPGVTGGTNGTTETYKLKMELINSGGDKIFDTKTLTLYGRVLPNHFVIAAKINGTWRALPADIATSSGNAIANAYPITVDNQTTPTVATAAPKTALYSGTVRAHNDHRGGIRLTTATGDGNDGQLQATRSDNAYLWRTTSDCTTGMQEWYLVSSNFSQYEVRLDGTLKRSNAGGEDAGDDSGNAVDRQLCVSGSQILFGKTLAKTMYILPVTEEFDPVEIQVVTWKSNTVQFMYLGNPTYTAEVEIEGVNKASAQALGSALKIDHGVYEIAVSDLMSNPNKQMHIIIKNGGSEIGRKAVTIPLMTNSATTVNAARTAASINKDDCSGLDLVVLGNVLTADDATAHAFNSVTVYGGAKLSVTGNLTTKKMYLRAGNVTAGTKGTTPVTSYSYVYPQVYVGSSSTLTINENIINFDYLTNYDQYFGVAFPHTLTIDKNNIFYPEDIYGSAAKPGSYLLRVFDSQIRAERGAVDDVWVDVETGSTAMPKQTMTTRGLGYYVLLPPRKVSVNGDTNTRQKYGIQRMKLSVANAAALTTAENSNATIAVTAYSASSIVNTGWWMLGNPYMASLGTGTGDADRVGGASITVGSIGTNAQGQYEWKSSSVRYVTVPDDGAGDTYDQRRVIDYDFPAFKPFYVQVGASGDVTFSYASRNTAAPARISNNNMPQEINVAVALSTATYGDTTYLLVGDGFSDEYEIGDDLMKMPHANVSLFTIGSTYDLFANALNKQSAENGVPVGYTAPSAGYYLFSHVENAESTWLEHLWLEDKETGAKVDLLDAPYEFETTAGTNKTRFVLFAVLKKNSETPTDIGGTEEEIDKPIKFIYNDKMYILRNGILYDATGKKVREINK